jgi:uncharacterized protein YukE
MSTTASLPAFSRNWVGGDIWGLQALSEQCGAVAPEIIGVDTALAKEVSSLVAAGSWRGKAASAFAARWDADSQAGQQLADAWAAIGKVIGELAACLAGLESKLEEAAYQLEKQGVAVDQATGVPLPDVTAGGNANVAPQQMAVAAKLAASYSSYRAQVLDAARTAREATAAQLTQIAGQLIPAGRDWGQLSTGLDALRSLWGIPTEYRQHLREALTETDEELTQTERSAIGWLIQDRKINGNNSLLPKDMRTAISEAQEEKGMLQSKLGSAWEPTSSKIANGDADGLGMTADGASGLIRVAGGAVRAIPLVGTSIGAGITIWQDLANHESMGHAVQDGVDSNAAGLIAGIGGGAAGEAAAGLFVTSGSVIPVVAGVAAGGVAAVGVGDFVHNMWQENWNADIHQYGVLGGTGHGIADSFDKTRHDMAHYGDDIIHLL